jgi:endo-1,4-beta-xylanase
LNNQKKSGAIALIKKIQAAGVHIDGVGIQGHWKAAMFHEMILKKV